MAAGKQNKLYFKVGELYSLPALLQHTVRQCLLEQIFLHNTPENLLGAVDEGFDYEAQGISSLDSSTLHTILSWK